MILHLADRQLAADANALWSDPSVFGDADMLHVSWAGQHLTLRSPRRGRQLPRGQAHRRRAAEKHSKLMRLPLRFIDHRWVLDFGGDQPSRRARKPNW